MSFRNNSQSALDVVRDIRDDIDQNQRNTGAVRQNTIRIGNWILGAVGNRLNFTNAASGIEHAYGGRERWSYSDVLDFDEAVVGAAVYPPVDIELQQLTITIQTPSNVPIGVGTFVNGEMLHSTALQPGQMSLKVALRLAVPSHARYWPQLTPAPGGTGEVLGIFYDYALI